MTLTPSGAVTESLISWRNGEKWQEVLLKLQKQADLVIVDGPSVEIASAQLLASKVDAVLLLIHLGKTRTDEAATALRQLQLVGARVAGVVLYRAPLYRSVRLPFLHRAKVLKKGGSLDTGNKLFDEETNTLL
jgi:hypothetical protein